MVFFGLIGAFFSSWFPIGLGLFLFFTNDDFIEWVLRTVGIRLVPDTFGSVFIKSFVFLIGLSAVLAYSRDSAPDWLLSEIPHGAPPWSLIAGGAVLIAALSTASAALVRLLLPELAHRSLTWTITRAVIALVMFGMLALFTYAFRPLHTRVSDEFPQATRNSRATASATKALGLTVPITLLGRADEAIE